MTIYDFKVKDSKENEISMEEYRGKVLLIVNTATGCAFTPQYNGLVLLHEKYQEKGFEVLDFPCNQFLNQAPGTNEEIAEFCQLRFGAKFRTFGKIKVNGQDTEPLYKYLKENSKGAFFGNEIKWNFTKFLIDREGNIVKRYAPTIKPEDLEKDIKDLL